MFPITVRCASLGNALDTGGLDEALARALGRAFDRAATLIGDDAIEVGPVSLGRRTVAMPRARELQSRVERVVGALVTSRIPETRIAPRPKPPSERFDPARFDPRTGGYVIPSYDGGKAVAIAIRKDEPFAEVLRELRLTINATADLIRQLRDVPDNAYEREQAIAFVEDQRDVGEAEFAQLQVVADVLAGRRKADSVTGASRTSVDARANFYYRPGQAYPAPVVVGSRIRELQTRRIYLSLVEERCARLDATAMLAEQDGPVRRGFFIVSAAYINVLDLALADLPSQLAFLDTLYRDPQTIVGYAVSRWAWTFLAGFWKSLRTMPSQFLLKEEINESSELTDRAPLNIYSREVAFTATANMTLQLNGFVARFGHDFPLSPGAITQIPAAQDAKIMAATILHLSIDIPLLALWAPVEPLQSMLYRTTNAGQHLYKVWGEQDRDVWLRDLNALRNAFSKEIAAGQHDDTITARVAAWENRMKQLCEDIPREVNRSELIAAAAEQIPFLFVGGALAKGAGEFVELVWGTSRWLRIIAEGAALTAFSTVLQIPRTPVTAGGVAVQLAINIGFAGLGSVMSGFSRDIGEGVVGLRRALLLFGGIAIPTVTLSAIQTVLTAVERDARKAGGDTDLTTVFTCDLALNALGLVFGAAFEGAKAKLPRTVDTNDNVALARALNISEVAAAAWRHYIERSAQFMDRAQKLNADYTAGRLSIADFEGWQRDGLSLIDEMLVVLPEIAQFLEGSQDPQTIRTGLQQMRKAIASADPRGRTARYPTPETLDLTRVGDSDTFVYDPNASPADLQRVYFLRRSLEERGWQISQEPGGGFRASLAGGQPIRVLPASRYVRGLLPPASLETLTRGQPQANEGLTALRNQTAVPGLEAIVAPAAARIGSARTISFLRVIRLLKATDGRSWNGLARFLREGGDLDALTRALSRRDSVEEREDQVSVMQSLLGMIQDPAHPWDASAIRGLGALYRLVPNLSSERFADLISNPEPVQVEGAMQTFDVLDRRARGTGSVVGQLAASWLGFGPYNRQAAAAVLHGAVEITQRFAGTTVAFEVATPDAAGTFERFQDLVAYETVPDPAGGGRSSRRAIFRLEYKDVLPSSIGRSVRKQFARDLILDYEDRVRAGVDARPPYAGFGWRLGREKLLPAALAAIVKPDPSPAEIDTALRDVVRGRLRESFTDPALLKAIPDTEIARYRQVFEATLAFVEFF